MRNDVEILEKSERYRGYFRIDRYRLRHRLFAGGWSGQIEREVFERGHAVGVLPYDPAGTRSRDHGRLVGSVELSPDRQVCLSLRWARRRAETDCRRRERSLSQEPGERV